MNLELIFNVTISLTSHIFFQNPIINFFRSMDILFKSLFYDAFQFIVWDNVASITNLLGTKPNLFLQP